MLKDKALKEQQERKKLPITDNKEYIFDRATGKATKLESLLTPQIKAIRAGRIAKELDQRINFTETDEMTRKHVPPGKLPKVNKRLRQAISLGVSIDEISQDSDDSTM